MEIETDLGIYSLDENDMRIFQVQGPIAEKPTAYAPAKIWAWDTLLRRLVGDLCEYEYLTEKEWTEDGTIHHCWFLGRRGCWIYTPKEKPHV